MKEKSMKLIFVLTITLAAIFLFFGSVSAQDGIVTDDEVNAIAKQIYCPVCENTPLDVCPTLVCEQWREMIRNMIADGWSEAEIKQYLVDKYGDRVLAMPPAQSPLNRFFYIFPVAVTAAGMIILFRSFKSWQKPIQVPEDNIPDPASDEYIQRIEEELRRR